MSSRISLIGCSPLDATGIRLIYRRFRNGQAARERARMTLTRMFVGGDWRAALDGAEDRAWSPATGEDLGAVAKGDREDARQAVAAAGSAFGGWAAETAFARAAALHRVADACERRRDELARALTLDQGKPLHAEAYDEVDELVAMWHAAAEDGRVLGAARRMRGRGRPTARCVQLRARPRSGRRRRAGGRPGHRGG